MIETPSQRRYNERYRRYQETANNRRRNVNNRRESSGGTLEAIGSFLYTIFVIILIGFAFIYNYKLGNARARRENNPANSGN